MEEGPVSLSCAMGGMMMELAAQLRETVLLKQAKWINAKEEAEEELRRLVTSDHHIRSYRMP